MWNLANCCGVLLKLDGGVDDYRQWESDENLSRNSLCRRQIGALETLIIELARQWTTKDKTKPNNERVSRASAR